MPEARLESTSEGKGSLGNILAHQEGVEKLAFSFFPVIYNVVVPPCALQYSRGMFRLCPRGMFSRGMFWGLRGMFRGWFRNRYRFRDRACTFPVLHQNQMRVLQLPAL